MEAERFHKRKKTIAKLLCLAVLVVFCLYYWYADTLDYLRNSNTLGFHIHNDEYIRTLGVNAFDYESVIKQYGEPERTETRAGQNGYPNHYIAYYPGLSMTYALVDHAITQDSGLSSVLVLLTITDETYRFGKQKIGVGSTREKIAAAFAGAEKIEADELAYSEWDFPDVDEGWYGDRWCRILFQYDKNDCVEKMAYEPSTFW